MSARGLVSEQLEKATRKWDEVMLYLEEGNDMPYGFLQLAKSDLETFSSELVCEYCSKQIETEIKLIGISLSFARIANEWTVTKGARAKSVIVGKAIPLIIRLTMLELRKNL